MTLERDHAAELFGLAGTFPRPGWVVLDAARDHRFTGELTFEVTPETRIYLDRGRIYLAERSTDPSLGARLVDAGALNAAQLEHGSMRIGETEHLGRLFERVPSVDRQSTLLITELMNESCVTWLAGQNVRAVTSTPYRHHPAGVHRWDRPADAIDLRCGDPLPAPPPSEAPIELAPPESIFPDASNDTDPVIHWNEASWLDERTSTVDRTVAMDTGSTATGPMDSRPINTGSINTGSMSSGRTAIGRTTTIDETSSLLTTDWVDRLETDGLPQPGSDPLAPSATLPTISVEPVDRFEVIWPSGEIDADFPATELMDAATDRDRAGPTARVVRTATVQPEPTGPIDESGLWDVATGPSFGPDDLPTRATTLDQIADPIVAATSDELALSMRRAVASIETGSLAARRRLSDTSQHESSRGIELSVPGRVATRSESSIWSANRAPNEAGRSVFDEPTTTSGDHADESNGSGAPPDSPPEPERVSALRRLIGGLRRR